MFITTFTKCMMVARTRDEKPIKSIRAIGSMVTTVGEALTGVIAMESSTEPREELRLGTEARLMVALTCKVSTGSPSGRRPRLGWL
jgi:hypothetical protein